MALVLVGLLATASLPGCNLWRRPITYEYKAQYTGLQDQRVAVLVRADPARFYNEPQAGERITGRITSLLAENVEGITVLDPREIQRFMDGNPYWASMTYRDLAASLDVSRIVLVELNEYRTNEPGNEHLWRGVVSARVSVIAADAADPDVPVFATDVRTVFPEGEEIGLLKGDREIIELGMVRDFTRDAAGLFHDYEIERIEF